MAPALGRERTDDGKFIIDLGELFESRTERDSRQAGGNLPGHAADFRRSVHLRVEGFELAGPAMHEEKDDRPILDKLGVLGKERAGFEQTRHASPPKSSKAEEASSPDSLAAQIQHNSIIARILIFCHANSLCFRVFLELPSLGIRMERKE